MGDISWTSGDCRLYDTQVDQALLQPGTDARPFPRLNIARRPATLLDYYFGDFEFVGYDPHPTIKAPVAV